MWKKPRLYDLQILQTDIWGKNFAKKKKKKKKTRKTHVLLENNQVALLSCQKKKHRQNYLKS